MMLVACILLSVFPPGIYFPRMSGGNPSNRISLASSMKPEKRESDSGNQTTEEGLISQPIELSSIEHGHRMHGQRVDSEEPMAYWGR